MQPSARHIQPQRSRRPAQALITKTVSSSNRNEPPHWPSPRRPTRRRCDAAPPPPVGPQKSPPTQQCQPTHFWAWFFFFRLHSYGDHRVPQLISRPYALIGNGATDRPVYQEFSPTAFACNRSQAVDENWTQADQLTSNPWRPPRAATGACGTLLRTPKAPTPSRRRPHFGETFPSRPADWPGGGTPACAAGETVFRSQIPIPPQIKSQ